VTHIALLPASIVRSTARLCHVLVFAMDYFIGIVSENVSTFSRAEPFGPCHPGLR